MGVCDVPAISLVCGAAGEAVGSVVAAPFESLAGAIGHAAGWLFETVWILLDTTTLVDLTDPDYISVFNLLFGIGVTLTLLFGLLQLIGGLLRRDPNALSTAVVGMGKAIIGSFVVVGLTGLLLQIVDQLSIGIVQATGASMDQLGARIGSLMVGLGAVNIAAPGAGLVITIFLGGLAISAAGLVWVSMLVRKALLLVAVVLAPIALSGQAWHATKGWFTRWLSFVVALAVSKLVIVVVFLVATTQMGAPMDFDLASLADPVAGVVLMFVAAFAPFMVYKLIAFAGVDMYHHMSTEQEARTAVQRPAQVATAAIRHRIPSILNPRSAGGGQTGEDGVLPPDRGGIGLNPTTTAAAVGGAASVGGAGAVVAGRVAQAASSGPTAGRRIAAAADGQADHAQVDQAQPDHSRWMPPRTEGPATEGRGDGGGS